MHSRDIVSSLCMFYLKNYEKWVGNIKQKLENQALVWTTQREYVGYLFAGV